MAFNAAQERACGLVSAKAAWPARLGSAGAIGAVGKRFGGRQIAKDGNFDLAR